MRARIDAARSRSAVAARDVLLIGVTKGCPAEAVDALVCEGVCDVGENRVQEALAKMPRVRERARWHMIGRLQRNKARRAAESFCAVHSVDSEELLRALARAGRPLEVFLQVNVSGEPQKGGIAPEGAHALWRAALASPPLAPIGLMTMAPFFDDPEAARPCFRALRELRDDIARRGDGPPPRALSMGMSGDFEVAVEEGATHVRVGTALLEGLFRVPGGARGGLKG